MESIMNEELRGTETVLVVDDEPEILHAAGILLGILGYVVFLAIKGEHALETCRKCRISLVIIDPEAYMVGMDGYEVIGRMKEIRPELRFLIMSGQDREDNEAEIGGEGFMEFIQKPFNEESLPQKIREALDGVNDVKSVA